MSRIKIDLPEEFIFETTYDVTINDINYGNHVGNDRFLAINNEIRIRWLKSLGFHDELSFGDSVGTIVADAALEFKKEAFYADELICSLGIADIHSRGFDLVNVIYRDGEVVCIVKTALLFVNYSLRKLTVVPQSLLDALGLEKP
jgi:acyl-CoA thioesterase FadM